jgi:hypothetical protein
LALRDPSLRANVLLLFVRATVVKFAHVSLRKKDWTTFV